MYIFLEHLIVLRHGVENEFDLVFGLEYVADLLHHEFGWLLKVWYCVADLKTLDILLEYFVDDLVSGLV